MLNILLSVYQYDSHDNCVPDIPKLINEIRKDSDLKTTNAARTLVAKYLVKSTNDNGKFFPQLLDIAIHTKLVEQTVNYQIRAIFKKNLLKSPYYSLVDYKWAHESKYNDQDWQGQE